MCDCTSTSTHVLQIAGSYVWLCVCVRAWAMNIFIKTLMVFNTY